jgi:hypothetical protein
MPRDARLPRRVGDAAGYVLAPPALVFRGRHARPTRTACARDAPGTGVAAWEAMRTHAQHESDRVATGASGASAPRPSNARLLGLALRAALVGLVAAPLAHADSFEPRQRLFDPANDALPAPTAPMTGPSALPAPIAEPEPAPEGHHHGGTHADADAAHRPMSNRERRDQIEGILGAVFVFGMIPAGLALELGGFTAGDQTVGTTGIVLMSCGMLCPVLAGAIVRGYFDGRPEPGATARASAFNLRFGGVAVQPTARGGALVTAAFRF